MSDTNEEIGQDTKNDSDNEEGRETKEESSEEGRETSIEKLVKKIEGRRENRIEVTWEERRTFLTACRTMAEELELGNKIPKDKINELCTKYKSNKNLVKVFDRAISNCEEVNEDEFYFRDFNQYELTLKRSVLKKYPALMLFLALALYFVLSAVFFCPILGDENVCPEGAELRGWVTTVYFSSVTMSTVGYGDVSVVSDESQVVEPLIGSLFMVLSLIYAVTVFSAVLEFIFKDFDGLDLNSFMFQRYLGDDFRELPLWQQLHRIKVVRMAELTLYFLLLNIFGMVIVKRFAKDSVPEWSWMTAFYWSVQTTTTIGYGDLEMPPRLQWFNIFFTLLGTAFLANILGSVANLRTELLEHRRYATWKRREVSKRLIQDMEGDIDGKITEFEFLVASLITLNKVSSNDISEIMTKFKELAGDDLYITQEDIQKSHDKSEAFALNGADFKQFEMHDMET